MKVISSLLNTRTGRILTRLFYLIPGSVLLYLILENHDQWYQTSSLNVQLLTLCGIPGIIFLYQGIRNSLLGRWLVMMLYLIYGFVMVQGFIDWYELVGVKNDLEEIRYWVLVFMIYLLVGVFLIIIKPQKRYV